MLDQHQDGAQDSSFNAVFSTNTRQQGVTTGISGLLAQIEIFTSGNSQLELFINKGAPWQSDTNDFSSTVSFTTSGWKNIDVSSAGLVFNAGDQFVIGIHGLNGNSIGVTTSSVNSYGGGQLYLNGTQVASGSYDIAFRTFVGQPDVVPESCSLIVWSLLGLTIGGANWWRRRRMAA
jgi:hypothetical protein